MTLKSKKIKTVILLIISIALMVSPIFIMKTKATEDAQDIFPGTYTIEYIMGHYNLVTLGDLNGLTHIVGPILVGGDLNSQLYHSQVTNNVSSYIKGKINNGGNVNSSDGTKPTLYLGNANTVDGMNVNGQWYTSNPIEITDNFVDFNRLYSSIRSQSKNLSEGTVVTPDENGVITIKEGTISTIETLTGVTNINVEANVNSKDLTLITIKDSGAITFPGMYMNGGQYNTNESSSAGTAIVWNMPNATSVEFPIQGFTGHLIAPNADVKYPSSNYGGCFIVKTISGNVEAHYYPYNDGTIPTGETEIPGGQTGGDNTTTGNGTVDPTDRNNTTENGTVDPADRNNIAGNGTVDPADRNNVAGNETVDPANRNNTSGNGTAVDSVNKNNTSGKGQADSANTNKKVNGNGAVKTGDKIAITIVLLIVGGIMFVISIKSFYDIKKMKK